MVIKHCGQKPAGHISRDATAIEAREKRPGVAKNRHFEAHESSSMDFCASTMPLLTKIYARTFLKT
jgi:hypothetical protein